MADMAMEPRMGLTFEQVWAALMELRESGAETERLLKESSAETERLLKESSADFDRRLQETERLLKENSAETERRLQETDKEIKALAKNIGGLNNSLGKLIEQMFSAQLWDKFAALGYDFTKGSNAIFKENKQTLAEVDIFLENGEYAMPVEVKTHLKEEDVDEHIERIEKIRGYMDRRGDERRLVGAVAGGTVAGRVRRYAQEQGLYVVEQSGECVNIAEAPAGFTARLW
ncbi:MAG: hypothetical protein LBG05_06895 [Treponema sp.]|jgi:hypothetical protein|nr:hypothetical protein [Treponema sp.]